MTARVTPDDGAMALIGARDIAADVLTREGAFRENLLGLGLPAAQVEDILDLFTVYRAGYAATVTPNIADILGSAPRWLATFVHDHRAVVTTDARPPRRAATTVVVGLLPADVERLAAR